MATFKYSVYMCQMRLHTEVHLLVFCMTIFLDNLGYRPPAPNIKVLVHDKKIKQA